MRRLWTAREEVLPLLRAWLILGVGLSVFLVLAKLDLSRLFPASFLALGLGLTLGLRLGLR